jgi:hypothetical protein
MSEAITAAWAAPSPGRKLHNDDAKRPRWELMLILADMFLRNDNAYFVATKSRHQLISSLADQSHIKPKNGDFYVAFMLNETQFPKIKNTRRTVTNDEFKAFEEFYANDHNDYPKSSKKEDNPKK